jgi:hypothetical protein
MSKSHSHFADATGLCKHLCRILGRYYHLVGTPYAFTICSFHSSASRGVTGVYKDHRPTPSKLLWLSLLSPPPQQRSTLLLATSRSNKPIISNQQFTPLQITTNLLQPIQHVQKMDHHLPGLLPHPRRDCRLRLQAGRSQRLLPSRRAYTPFPQGEHPLRLWWSQQTARASQLRRDSSKTNTHCSSQRQDCIISTEATSNLSSLLNSPLFQALP